jgi:hypothetical protein
MRLPRKLALTVVAVIDALVLKHEYITGLNPDGSGVKVDEFRTLLVFYTNSEQRDQHSCNLRYAHVVRS